MFCKKIGTGLDNNQITFTGKIPRNSFAKQPPLTGLLELKVDVLRHELGARSDRTITNLEKLLKSFDKTIQRLGGNNASSKFLIEKIKTANELSSQDVALLFKDLEKADNAERARLLEEAMK